MLFACPGFHRILLPLVSMCFSDRRDVSASYGFDASDSYTSLLRNPKQARCVCLFRGVLAYTTQRISHRNPSTELRWPLLSVQRRGRADVYFSCTASFSLPCPASRYSPVTRQNTQGALRRQPPPRLLRNPPPTHLQTTSLALCRTPLFSVHRICSCALVRTPPGAPRRTLTGGGRYLLDLSYSDTVRHIPTFQMRSITSKRFLGGLRHP